MNIRLTSLLLAGLLSAAPLAALAASGDDADTIGPTSGATPNSTMPPDNNTPDEPSGDNGIGHGPSSDSGTTGVNGPGSGAGGGTGAPGGGTGGAGGGTGSWTGKNSQ